MSYSNSLRFREAGSLISFTVTELQDYGPLLASPVRSQYREEYVMTEWRRGWDSTRVSQEILSSDGKTQVLWSQRAIWRKTILPVSLGNLRSGISSEVLGKA